MYIDIHDHTNFREIQDTFASYYPFLRLAFYRQGHTTFGGSDEEDALAPRMTLGAFKKTHVSGLLEIQPWYKVADLERELQNRFGLPAQVLRKDRNSWVQTAGLDELSLKELNELSRNASDEYITREDEEGYTPAQDLPGTLL